MRNTVLVCLLAVSALLLIVLFPAPVHSNPPASVSVSPSTLSFGSVAVGSTNASATILVSSGHHPVTITGISSNLPVFVISGPSLPYSLSSRSSVMYHVAFAPSDAVTYNGTITVQTNSSVYTVAVSGTGLSNGASPTLTYLLTSSVTNLNFGSVLVGAGASQALSLTNSGTGNVSISRVSVSGNAFAVTGFSGSVTLSPGQNLPLSVTFTPTSATIASGIISVVSNAANSPSALSLSGTGIQPLISVAPASVSFGNIATGKTGSQTLTVSNPGSASLTITQANLTGTGFSLSGVSAPLTIAPGASQLISVAFSPASAGTYSGTLALSNNSPTANYGVTLSGTGVAPVLQLSISPASLSFGSVTTGTSASQSLSVTNTGTGSVTISQVAATGTGYTVSGFSGSMTLSPGQSLPLSASFAPSTAGAASGSISVVSTAANSPSTIALSGTGVQPLISVTPSSVSFGNVPTGTTNSQTLTISNPGSASLTITQASLTGTGFSFSGMATPLTIAPGASHSCSLFFTPTTAGSVSGTLSLTNNSPTPSYGVAVSGSGIASILQLSASPASVNFGSVTNGSSASQTVTLTNTGNASVSLSQDAVSGSGFSASGITFPLTLAASQSTSFNVGFAPSATGSVSGTVVVTSNATNSPTTITLAGTGAAPVSHTVALSWTPSSSSFAGFDIYRSAVSGGPYTQINPSMVTATSFVDSTVASGHTYYYVATELNSSGTQSPYSNETTATIP